MMYTVNDFFPNNVEGVVLEKITVNFKIYVNEMLKWLIISAARTGLRFCCKKANKSAKNKCSTQMLGLHLYEICMHGECEMALSALVAS